MINRTSPRKPGITGGVMLRCLLVLAALAAWNSPASAGLVYVARSGDAFGSVDLSTGVYTAIGTTPVQLQALTFAPSGVLYGIGSDNMLYQVNPLTAGLTLVGPTGSFFDLVALAARGDGAFFGSDSFSDEYRVNSSTGMATALGSSGLSSSFVQSGGMAFGPGGILYLDYGTTDSTDTLYTVNQSTGLASKVGNTGAAVDGLVFSGGQAYGFNFFGEIYKLNTATGAATDTHVAIGGGISFVEAAAAAPEPASLMLLGSGLAGLTYFAWRRRRGN